MSYLPVEPESGIVHEWAHPEQPWNTRTVCGINVDWVRSILFIEETAPLCPTCDPFPNPVTAPVTTTESE